MSDDGPNRDEKKEHPTRITGTGKELLDWLTPTSSSSHVSDEQPSDGSHEPSGQALDRRSYMLLAGGAAAAAATGGVASASASASGTQISQPDIYGYGGRSLLPDSDQTTLLSNAVSQTITQTEENEEREQAMEIAAGVQVDAILDPATVDWFVFDATAGDLITVEYDRDTNSGLTGILLYGPDGRFKEKLYVATGNVHTMRTLAEESGEHFLQVIEVKNGDGPYSFSILLDESDDDDDDGDDSDDGDGGDDGDDGDDGHGGDDDGDDGDDSDDGDEFGKLGYGEGPYGGTDA